MVLLRKNALLAFMFSACSLTLTMPVKASVQQAASEQVMDKQKSQASHNQWLKDKFGDQHQKLIPIVAVADMFYACNKARKTDPIGYQVKDLITRMDKNLLADKLAACLAGESVKSDLALNFGLEGCFHEQLAKLSKERRKVSLPLVEKAIASLSRTERQKSLTQCVTQQAIDYLR